ncbi:MAG TPA: hypothetical protein VFD19_04605, partial [Clostridia bacterium]|nr:hypothetical protein [Clostridia bacterium]
MNLPKQKKFSGFSFYIILMMVILLATFMMSRADRVKDSTLFEVEQMIMDGTVETVSIDGSALTLEMSASAVQAGSPETVKKDIPIDAIPQYLDL